MRCFTPDWPNVFFLSRSFISWCASLIGLQAEAPTSRFRTSIQSNNILQNQQPVPCLPYPSRDGLCISSENLVFIIVQGFFKSIADIVRTLKCPATLQLPTPIHATSWSTYWTDLWVGKILICYIFTLCIISNTSKCKIYTLMYPKHTRYTRIPIMQRTMTIMPLRLQKQDINTYKWTQSLVPGFQ